MLYAPLRKILLALLVHTSTAMLLSLRSSRGPLSPMVQAPNVEMTSFRTAKCLRRDKDLPTFHLKRHFQLQSTKGFEENNIDIDDVLAEAEDALMAAQQSLNNRQSAQSVNTTQSFGRHEIDIEDVLAEAEDALQTAMTALILEEPSIRNAESIADGELAVSLTEAVETIREANSKDFDGSKGEQAEKRSSAPVKEVMAATVGGAAFGSVFSMLILARGPELLSGMLIADGLAASIPIVLGGASFVGATTEGPVGSVTRAVLGGPTMALNNAVGGMLTDATNKAVGTVQSIPGRVADAAVDTVKAIPGRVANAAKAKADADIESLVQMPGKVKDAAFGYADGVAKSAQDAVVKAVEDTKQTVMQPVDDLVDSNMQRIEELKAVLQELKLTVAQKEQTDEMEDPPKTQEVRKPSPTTSVREASKSSVEKKWRPSFNPIKAPLITNWVKNSDDSVTGTISGSKKFRDGDRITTAVIVSIGRIKSGEVVTTTSGSRYELA